LIRDLYPGWDVLSQRGSWDEATRKVVLDRVQNVPPYTFFDDRERRTLEALAEQVAPQAHRPAERRLPIGPWIDQLCADGGETGTRFADMPPLPEAWRLGLAGLDQAADASFGAPFAALDGERQREVLRAVVAGDPPGEAWSRLPAARWWSTLAVRQIAGVYYAHPYAWDEIGFGGPAYPRGYYALHHGAPEPWEPRERDSYRDEELGAR
jgi:hypothetical protein